ncbi:MAG: LptF/LptG family permease [Candidatus Eremiobacteraeota bacterium]|nr:LptF/LptG family permease [Candidatus Eremiobacteraeota bacterium]
MERALAALREAWPTFPAVAILDRYMVAELGGPFAFGLSAFALIFAATNLLAISRLIAEQHAPLVSAMEYFFWQFPQILITVVPMAMLLGVLLALQRISGESELTALKAGGVGLVRAVAPLLIVGFAVSVLSLVLQEGVVPYANDRATYLRENVIKQVGAFGGGSHTVTSSLPGGGRQVTFFVGYDPVTQSLLDVTLIKYDALNKPQVIVFADRAKYQQPTWTFSNAQEYSFNPDGTTHLLQAPQQQVDVGERPSQIQETITNKNREEMSRSQLREVVASGQLSPPEMRAYQTTYEEKLARPFASFVFALIAVPFGLRAPRSGGGTGLGFGLAVAIVFVYFVIASVASAFTSSLNGGYVVSALGAWMPNALFTGIGAYLLQRAAR